MPRSKQSPSERQLWEKKLKEKVVLHHKRNIDKVVKKLMKKVDSAKSSMISRSKKYNVECNITADDLREMAYESYGTKCKYSGRILKLDNMVFDHIIPISKGGTSNKDNIQIISRFSNNLKGSLSEENFFILMNWLESVPEELKKDISIRLTHGIH